MARLPDPFDTLSPDAKRVYDKISAKRGAIRGPFASLMHHPALAERVGDLGEFLRFDSSLPGDIRELAILITARAVSQTFEWYAHAKIARTEKLPDDVIERVRSRGDLGSLPARYLKPAREVQRELGMSGLMELVVLAGHYRLIAGVLFAFDTPLPPGEAQPFS
jgi:4-carboxymuconolactone decarboxylase